MITLVYTSTLKHTQTHKSTSTRTCTHRRAPMHAYKDLLCHIHTPTTIPILMDYGALFCALSRHLASLRALLLIALTPLKPAATRPTEKRSLKLRTRMTRPTTSPLRYTHPPLPHHFHSFCLPHPNAAPCAVFVNETVHHSLGDYLLNSTALVTLVPTQPPFSKAKADPKQSNASPVPEKGTRHPLSTPIA